MGGKLFGLFASDAGKPLYDKLQWQTIEYIPHYGLAEEKKVDSSRNLPE